MSYTSSSLLQAFFVRQKHSITQSSSKLVKQISYQFFPLVSFPTEPEQLSRYIMVPGNASLKPVQSQKIKHIEPDAPKDVAGVV